MLGLEQLSNVRIQYLSIDTFLGEHDWKRELEIFQKDRITQMHSISIDPEYDQIFLSYHTHYRDSATTKNIIRPHIRFLRFLHDLGHAELSRGIKYYIRHSKNCIQQFNDGYLITQGYTTNGTALDHIDYIYPKDKDWITSIVLGAND